MPSEEIQKGSSQDWLLHAHSDLELARTAKSPKILFESLCFHAQQAVEKALKAILVAESVPVVKTHNIGTLLDLLPKRINPPADVLDAVILTDYAVSSRYPGDLEPISEEEYQETVRLAQCVIKWAEDIIQQPFLSLGKKER